MTICRPLSVWPAGSSSGVSVMSWPFSSTLLSVQPCGSDGAEQPCVEQAVQFERPVVVQTCLAAAGGHAFVGLREARADLHLLRRESSAPRRYR